MLLTEDRGLCSPHSLPDQAKSPPLVSILVGYHRQRQLRAVLPSPEANSTTGSPQTACLALPDDRAARQAGGGWQERVPRSGERAGTLDQGLVFILVSKLHHRPKPALEKLEMLLPVLRRNKALGLKELGDPGWGRWWWGSVGGSLGTGGERAWGQVLAGPLQAVG